MVCCKQVRQSINRINLRILLDPVHLADAFYAEFVPESKLRELEISENYSSMGVNVNIFIIADLPARASQHLVNYFASVLFGP